MSNLPLSKLALFTVYAFAWAFTNKAMIHASVLHYVAQAKAYTVKVGHTKSYDRLRMVATGYRKWTQVNVSERTSNVRHLCDH